MEDKILLNVKNLKKYFPVSGGFLQKEKKYVKAVDDVSFYVKKGETFGLVGESGCGKSTTGRTLIRLYDVTAGVIEYDGVDISKMSERELFPYRKKIQMIYQDPYASLNPRMTVSDIIGEPLDIYHLYEGKERQERIYELLNTVGLGKDHASRYPHEFSGGQRQRVALARLMAYEPDVLLFDEPFSALDEDLKEDLLKALKSELRISKPVIFVSHNKEEVNYLCDLKYKIKEGKII